MIKLIIMTYNQLTFRIFAAHLNHLDGQDYGRYYNWWYDNCNFHCKFVPISVQFRQLALAVIIPDTTFRNFEWLSCLSRNDEATCSKPTIYTGILKLRCCLKLTIAQCELLTLRCQLLSVCEADGWFSEETQTKGLLSWRPYKTATRVWMEISSS